jgi:hypothetical protein
MTRTHMPGATPRGFDSSTKPPRSRDRISLMTASEAPLLANVRASAAGRGVINTSVSASNAAPVLGVGRP